MKKSSSHQASHKVSQQDNKMTKENQPLNYQIPTVMDKIIKADDDNLSNECTLLNDTGEFIEEDTATNTNHEESSTNVTTVSEFREAECGEPFREQFIRLDFTPVDGIDHNDDIYKKCRGFWELLEKHKELHHLKVEPEKESYKHKSANFTSATVSENSVEQRDYTIDKVGAPDLAAIDWLKREDIMSNAFKSLEQKRYCDHQNYDYCDEREVEQKEKITSRKRKNRLASIKPPSISTVGSRSGCRSQSITSIKGRRPTVYNVENLVSQMKEWDLKHARDMESPYFSSVPSQLTTGYIDTVPVIRDVSCCQLPCDAECPSTVGGLGNAT